MKILFGIHNFNRPNHWTQPRQFVYQIGRFLARYGHEIFVLTDRCIEGNIDGLSISGVDTLRPSNSKQIMARIAALSPDVAIWSISFTSVLTGYKFYKGFDIPLIGNFSFPNYSTRQVLRLLPYLHTKPALYYMANNAFKRPAAILGLKNTFVRIVCQSKRNTELLSRLGVSSQTLWHIPPGIDRQIWLRSELPSPERHDYRFLYFGPARRTRGLSNVIRAFGLLTSTHPEARLRLLLRGATDGVVAQVNSGLATHGIGSAASIRGGWLSREQLREEIWQSHTVVIPFLLSESDMPLSILEAKACGRFVISTDVASVRELVGSGGIVTEPNSPRLLAAAMAQVIEDRGLAESLQRHVVEEMARYPTWESVTQDFMQRLRDVIRKN